MEGYTCKECGSSVVINNGSIIRSCDHVNAVVIASMSAVATGESTLEYKPDGK